MEGFLRYRIGGLTHGWRGLFSKFYSSFLRVICLKVRSDCKWIEGCAYVSVMRVWESYLINNAAI